nr:thiamine-phosphate kinase [Sulfobacillus harzensis]
MQSAPPPGMVGIGDDAAVLPAQQRGWLISQDMLVEDIHFRWDWSAPEQVGVKAAHVNMSDIAAMGGRPRAALTSVAVPGSLSSEVLESLYRGLTRAFDPFGVVIVGGDTVGAVDKLVLDVTILGEPGPGGPVMRQGARPGDRLLVSGRLGASYAGYMLLSHGIGWPGTDIDDRSVLTAHLEPQARVELGLAVAPFVHAMTDVSDGLVDEVRELTRFGSVGADVWLERLPICPATRRVGEHFGGDGRDYALYGGEDYELLMAVPPSHLQAVQEAAEATAIPLTEIGAITDRRQIRWLDDGNPVAVKDVAFFDHFSR